MHLFEYATDQKDAYYHLIVNAHVWYGAAAKECQNHFWLDNIFIQYDIATQTFYIAGKLFNQVFPMDGSRCCFPGFLQGNCKLAKLRLCDWSRHRLLCINSRPLLPLELVGYSPLLNQLTTPTTSTLDLHHHHHHHHHRHHSPPTSQARHHHHTSACDLNASIFSFKASQLFGGSFSP